MISIDEVDVSVPGRTKQNRIAFGAAGSCVGGRILFAKISFNFDNAGGQALSGFFAHEDFAQQRARYAARVVSKEFPGEGENRELRHATES